MVIKALNRKLFRDLMGLKVQTLTVALLVICGVSLLISAWSAYKSLTSARDNYYDKYHFADIFSDLKKAPNNVINLLQKTPGVEILETRIIFDGFVKTEGQIEPSLGRFISIPNGKQPSLNRLHIRQGHLPIYSRDIEVLVHEGFANAHNLRTGDSITALIQGQNRQMKIAGIALSPEFVYALGPATPLPDDKHFGIFWVNRESLEQMTGMSGAFNNVIAGGSRNGSVELIKNSFDRILKQYGNRGSYSRDRQISNLFVEDEIRQQKSSAIVSPAIFLGIAAFLVHVISSRLISMHRSQIATLKALGYSSSTIFWHYLKMILVMMLIGAIPGIALGGILGSYFTDIYQSYFRFPDLRFALDTKAVVIGLAAGILPGFLGAFTSIRSAAKLQPAEAMRPPLPPAFHFNILDRMGLPKRMKSRQKWILRNLLFRPLRLIMIIFGISMATAIVIASTSWSDMITFLLDTQFQKIQHEDIAVSFLTPQHQDGLRELSKVQGVLAVEGYRSVPIRIRFRNHKRELMLMGWPEQSSMRRRLDRNLVEIPLPHEGILLSRYFEKKWNLNPGDSLDVELLDGTNKTFSVAVTGFTDDLLGTSATMSLDKLWNILKEEPSYNIAMLLADEKDLGNLYVDLQGYPKVASISVRNTLFHGLERSFAEIIRNSSLVLIFFALLIALGIVYNTVRVSFSERAWEMASLRVIGFDQKTVFGMLLSEVGVQVLLAIVPGCLIGWGLVHFMVKMVHTESFGFPVIIQMSTFAKGIIVVLIALTISSWAVFVMIKKINLADALKARE